MKLSKRLQEIASFIDDSDKKVYDVGCDHALLDIYLASKYKNSIFNAIDISEKCIENARIRIKKSGFEKRIVAKVNNGLKDFDIEENSTLVISGMGTHTIIEILNECDVVNFKKIIIQSNNDLELLRRHIVELGFIIKKEISVYDKKHYVIIEFIPGISEYNDDEYFFGPYLMQNSNKNKLYFSYLLTKYKEICKKIPIFNLKKKILIFLIIKKLKRLLKK